MTRSTRKAARAEPPVEGDGQAYSAFIASVQPVRIELKDVSARAAHSDAAEVSLQVESKFVVTCPQKNETGFTAEARLDLRFLTGEGEEVGHLHCTYRLDYQADMALGEGLLDQFSRRNAPINVWPFMRELVMNLTQRFGWSGFVLPSFLIPASPLSPDPAPATEHQPVRKTRKKPITP